MEFIPLQKSHWPMVWHILAPEFRAGETYPQAMDISEGEARAYWMNPPVQSYVALKDGAVLGVFYLKPNQPALGAHVCNAGYAVSPEARGQGLGAEMCIWSQAEARRQGYLAMQYNLVVSTNTRAVALWQRQGFEIAGRLPKAFRHKRLGLVDAFVMYKEL
ncbi:MAG: GNAT family N-acetyltransferase [Rhodobacteraceae bacterium]|nr:GNAT family N-acetyltransferase [Paracoccaceae bacterium]